MNRILSGFCFNISLHCCGSADFDFLIDADPDLDFLFDAYPDPTFHPDADPDPDPEPSLQIKAQTLEKVLK